MTIKHQVLALAAVLFFSTSLSAQSITTKLFGPDSKWKVKRAGLTLGVDQDMLNNLDHTYFTSMLDPQTRALYEGIDYDQQYKYAGICENPHVRLNLSLIPTMMKNTEVNLALNAIFARNDGVSYHNVDDKLGQTNYLNMDIWGHEVNADVSIVKTKTLLNTFRFYGGIGTNLGYTFGNYMTVNASDTRTVLDYSLLETGELVTPTGDRTGFNQVVFEETFEYWQDHKVNDGISQRLFAQAGFGILILRKFEIGMEGRLGYGYRYHFGREVVGARLQSFGLTARWILGPASPWLKRAQ